MKLIPKDALVAEIERRKKQNVLNEGAFEEDIDILSLINTLEVKEVDLEKPHKGEQNSSRIIGKDHLPEVRKKVAEKLLEASLNYYEAERACCEMNVPQEWKEDKKKLYDTFIWTCQDYIVLNESDEVEEDELNYCYE